MKEIAFFRSLLEDSNTEQFPPEEIPEITIIVKQKLDRIRSIDKKFKFLIKTLDQVSAELFHAIVFWGMVASEIKEDDENRKIYWDLVVELNNCKNFIMEKLFLIQYARNQEIFAALSNFKFYGNFRMKDLP